MAAVHTRSLNLGYPAPALLEQARPPRFKVPMKVEELAKFREALSLTAGQQNCAIGSALSSLRQSAEQTCKDDRETPSKVKLAPLNTQVQQIEEEIDTMRI